MRKSAIHIGAAVLAAVLQFGPIAALAQAPVVDVEYIFASAVTDADGSQVDATSFEPVITIGDKDEEHLTFKWETNFNCGGAEASNYLDPEDPRTPLTITWDHSDCGNVVPRAAIGLAVLYDGDPIFACEYAGGAGIGSGTPCQEIGSGPPTAPPSFFSDLGSKLGGAPIRVFAAIVLILGAVLIIRWRRSAK